MHKNGKKIRLNRETLRALEPSNLAGVAGGVSLRCPSVNTCGNPCSDACSYPCTDPCSFIRTGCTC